MIGLRTLSFGEWLQFVQAAILAATAFLMYWSVRAVKISTQAQLMSNLLQLYAGKEMLTAIGHLEIARRSLVEARRRGEPVDLREVGSWSTIAVTDQPAQWFAQHLKKIYKLHRDGLLTSKQVLTITDENHIRLLFEVVESLERSTDPDYDQSSYLFYAQLYSLEGFRDEVRRALV